MAMAWYKKPQPQDTLLPTPQYGYDVDSNTVVDQSLDEPLYTDDDNDFLFTCEQIDDNVATGDQVDCDQVDDNVATGEQVVTKQHIQSFANVDFVSGTSNQLDKDKIVPLYTKSEELQQQKYNRTVFRNDKEYTNFWQYVIGFGIPEKTIYDCGFGIVHPRIIKELTYDVSKRVVSNALFCATGEGDFGYSADDERYAVPNPDPEQEQEQEQESFTSTVGSSDKETGISTHLQHGIRTQPGTSQQTSCSGLETIVYNAAHGITDALHDRSNTKIENMVASWMRQPEVSGGNTLTPKATTAINFVISKCISACKNKFDNGILINSEDIVTLPIAEMTALFIKNEHGKTRFIYLSTIWAAGIVVGNTKLDYNEFKSKSNKQELMQRWQIRY